MSGIIGKKLGMTSIFDATGRNIICTVVEAAPNAVTQIKSTDGADGYDAVQLAYDERPVRRTTKAMQGHFARTGTTPKRKVIEFRNFAGDAEEGGTVSITDLFVEGEKIDVTGTSKGKGFQGVVKRHGFSGVGGSTHGQHNRQRAPGSIGMASTPSRVFKGMKMAGRTGNDRVTVKNLVVARILADSNLILVKGAIPGAKGGYVELHKQPARG